MDLLEHGFPRIVAEQGVKGHRLNGAHPLVVALRGDCRSLGCDGHRLALAMVLGSFVQDGNDFRVLVAQSGGQEGYSWVILDQNSGCPE